MTSSRTYTGNHQRAKAEAMMGLGNSLRDLADWDHTCRHTGDDEEYSGRLTVSQSP